MNFFIGFIIGAESVGLIWALYQRPKKGKK